VDLEQTIQRPLDRTKAQESLLRPFFKHAHLTF
jgi:hypothetical protein